MLVEKIVQLLALIVNGSFFHLKYWTELPLSAKAKKNGVKAIKVVDTVCRKGLEYSNQNYIKYLVQELGYTLTGELSHGEWNKDYSDIIDFTDKNGKYTPKVRCYLSSCIKDNANKPINKSKVEYQVNGQTVSYQELKDMDILQPSFFKAKENDTPQKLARLDVLEQKFKADKTALTQAEKDELLKLSKWAYNKTIEINCEHIMAIG